MNSSQQVAYPWHFWLVAKEDSVDGFILTNAILIALNCLLFLLRFFLERDRTNNLTRAPARNGNARPTQGTNPSGSQRSASGNNDNASGGESQRVDIHNQDRASTSEESELLRNQVPTAEEETTGSART